MAMNGEVKKRLDWVKLYELAGNALIVCLRCGIIRPTFRKWLKRYKEFGFERLKELSRRPHKIHYKITKENEQRILD